MNARNINELKALLDALPGDARIYSTQPPFSGVRLVPQEDGAVLFCEPVGGEESLTGDASR